MHLIPYLNHGVGGFHCSLLIPPLAWVMGQALGGAARCIFFLDLSHGFAWELNWETYRPEDTWWRASISDIIDYIE